MYRTWRSMIWQLHSVTPGSYSRARMIAISGLIDANGLPSSWATIARKSLTLRFVSTMSRAGTLMGVHGFQDIDSSGTELPAIGGVDGVDINCTTRYLVRDARHTLREDECRRSSDDGSTKRSSAHDSVQIAGNGRYDVDPWGAHIDTWSVIRKWCFDI